MSIQPIPAPTALLMVTGRGKPTGAGPVGVDLVCTPEDGIARVLVPVPGSSLAIRLDFTRAQLGALLDELVELADVLEQSPEPAPLTYGGC